MSNKGLKQRLFCFITAFIMCLSLCSFGVKAEGGRVVRISCGINNFLYLDENGSPEGYCSAYINRLARINNWQLEYVDTSWSEAVEMLDKGEIDILFPTAHLPEREETMDFSELIGGYNISGLFARDNGDYSYNDYEGFEGARIAVTPNTSNEHFLKSFAEEKGFSYTPVYISSINEKIEALERGEADMVVFSATNDVSELRLVSVISAEPFYYTVKKGNSELLDELDSGMEQILMSDPDIVAETFSNGMEGANNARLAFTGEEKDFIARGEEIRVGFYRSTEPLAYVDSEGNYDGIYVQLLNKAKEISGANITLYPLSRDDKWRDKINDGTIDFYIGAACRIASSEGSYICAEPFMDYETAVITKKDYVMPEDGINSGTVALTSARSYWEDNFPDKFNNMDIIYCKTAKDCLLAVKSGRADMTVLNTIEYNYQSKNSRFSDLIQWDRYKFKTGTAIAGTPGSDSLKLSVINKAMSALTEDEINNVIDMNLNMSYETSDLADYMYSARYVLIVVCSILVLLVTMFMILYDIKSKQREQDRLAQEHEKHQLRIMAALSNDYLYVYYINLDKDTFSIEKLSDKVRAEVAAIVKSTDVFSEAMNTYIDTLVLPEYRGRLHEITDSKKLAKLFKKDKSISLRYKVCPNSSNQEYFEISVSDVSSGDNEHIAVMGIRCVDEIAREELRQKQVLENTNETLRRQIKIVDSFSSIYFVTFTGDFVNNTIKEVDMPIYARPMIDESDGDLKKGLEIMTDRFISESSADKVREFADISTMPERIGDRSVISCEYMDIHSSWRRFNVIPMERGEDGRVTKAVFTIQIIDEEKQKELKTQEALRSAFESANKANNAKSDFLSKMSHDMRTPMNAIIGMTAIAGAHIDEKERVLDCLNKITTSSRHLLGLINEVLDMSKIESGKMSLAEDEFNLSELLNSTLAMLQEDIKKHGHKLQVHIRNITHEDVAGDSLRLQQVILNIIGNAIKYTPDNGNICLTVSERPAREHMLGCYEFIFEDDGIGMSEDYLQQLFVPFSRAEDVRISRIQGTGLGMTITQNIVHMMNGDIRVESEIGKGSRFTVTVLLKLLDKSDVISTEALEGLPVLVADDDSIACETTCELLNEIGMVGEWVLSGMEAVKRVEETHSGGNDFYAVILDWQMPEMDGVETAKAIKRIVGDDIPVIIISAYDWSDIEAEAREAGVTAFISKPVFKSGLIRLFTRLGKNDGTAENEDESGTDGIDSLSECDFSHKRALLVEDNELNREIAAEILKMTGISVEEAVNGKEALNMFAASPQGYYDIIFMDIQMPVMNGYESAEAIRALDRDDAAEVAVVAMTANAFTEDIQASKRAGMNDHLAKPIDFNTLTAVLKKYLQ